MGYSWPSLLRFAPVVAHAPGKYRVCFCDSTLRACRDETDFRIEAGTLHVSGVACLLASPKFRTGCYNQWHGGLRCGIATPPFPTIPAGPELPSMSNTEAVQSMWAHCTAATPDEQDRELCHALRNFYSTLRLS